MKRKRIYLETSIFSYLAAHTSRDLVVSAWQEVTQEFWDQHREAYDLVASQLVVEECSVGDPDMVERRLALLHGMRELVVDNAVKVVAAALLSKGGVPRGAEFDALHIAVAAVGGADYLLTWNCRHLNNPVTKPRVRAICEHCGYVCPEICTPFELTEGGLR